MPGRWRRLVACWRLARLSILGLALASLAAPSAGAAETSAIESAVKATYLYKLPPFIAWPSTSFDGPNRPLVICIVGRDPFGASLDSAVAGLRIGERPIAVRRLEQAGPQAGCHVMYLGGSAAQSVAAALAAMQGAPTLTVTDRAIGDEAKGMVHFVVRDNRVRFEIDNSAAAAAGLGISSKVLALATDVR